MNAILSGMALSFSQLSTYRRCPKHYEYAVIKKVPRRISSGESFGSSIHNTLKRFGELEMNLSIKTEPANQLHLFVDEKQSAPANKTLDATLLATLWRECFIAEGYATRAERDACILRGDNLLKQFFTWWQKEKRTVISIESGFKLEIPPSHNQKPEKELILSGRFDRVERTDSGLHIIDYKTGTPRSQTEIDADLQLSIYALAAADIWHEPIAKLTMLFLGEESLVEMSTTRNQSQLNDALTAIRILHEGIARGDFHATPTREKCGYCPYREICPFRVI